MSLPSLIEIAPRSGLSQTRMTIPGSKSITNRALILAALGKGTTILRGALWSEDTQVMVESLVRLGFKLTVESDLSESANRTITVRGEAGRIPLGGGDQVSPLELNVANAGTAARFLTALVCLGQGYFRLSGVPRMHERPQSSLFSALRQLGYELHAVDGRLPVIVHGRGPLAGCCRVSLAESSQFASALLLCADVGGWKVVIGDDGESDEMPYVTMTEKLVASFPREGGDFFVEPDASSASYFWAAGWILGHGNEGNSAPLVSIRNWPTSNWQIDSRFPALLPLPKRVSRETDLGDSILTAMVVAAEEMNGHSVEFVDLGRLRVQECERVAAMRTELTRCGASVTESGDTLRIEPRRLHGAVLETYQDHRMAMCWAVLGLKVPGIKIRDPRCVRKTFPNFFWKLVAAQPDGLGASIWECDPVTLERRRQLTRECDLLAE